MLASGVKPLVLEGVTCSENEPWEWVVDFVSPTPAVVVDQALGSSNPKTSVAVSASRATLTSPSSLCDPPQPIAAVAATTAVISDRATNCELVFM